MNPNQESGISSAFDDSAFELNAIPDRANPKLRTQNSKPKTRKGR